MDWRWIRCDRRPLSVHLIRSPYIPTPHNTHNLQQASPLLRFSLRRWRDALSLTAALALLLSPAPTAIPTIPLPLPTPPPPLLRALAWATGLHLLLLYLPHTALLKLDPTPTAPSPLAPNPTRAYPPLTHRLRRLLGRGGSNAITSTTTTALRLAALPPLLTPGLDPREKLKVVGDALAAAQPPPWRVGARRDVWKARLEELRAKEVAAARAARRREQELFELRAAAAALAVERATGAGAGGDGGRTRREEGEDGDGDERGVAAPRSLWEAAGAPEEEEDEEAAMFSDPLRQMTLVLGRRPRPEEMKWADGVLASASAAAGGGNVTARGVAAASFSEALVEGLIDEWVVRCVKRVWAA